MLTTRANLSVVLSLINYIRLISKIDLESRNMERASLNYSIALKNTMGVYMQFKCRFSIHPYVHF